jgi:VIT1/CCC1 family predicted Fe2+/Mn2+ transporter
VQAVLLAALGCNLAWAIIDAILYSMAVRGGNRLAVATIQAIRDAESPAAARATVADHLPAAVLPALTASDLDRIRIHLSSLPPETLESPFGQEDYLAALGVFLLGFLCVFPVVAPFLLTDATLALRLSNIVAVAMLFLTGFTFGRQVGRPWRTGFLMVTIGMTLVAVAIALGG